MEEQILYKVLHTIKTNNGLEHEIAPTGIYYLRALETIGLVVLGWQNELTKLGETIYNFLKDKQYNYGT